MVIVETSVFTGQITGLLSDEEYRAFQEALVRDPKLGDVIPGSGGLRSKEDTSARELRALRALMEDV